MAAFVAQSPSFRLRDLAAVDVPAAMELLDVNSPDTFSAYDGESADQFLDRLRFPDGARHLALEVFARSFFAHPEGLLGRGAGGHVPRLLPGVVGGLAL